MLFGWPDIRIVRAFRQEHERLRKGLALEEKDDPYRQQIQRTATRLGLTNDEVMRAVQHWMIDRPARWLRLFRRRWLIETITAYRRAGGKTAIVSDYPARKKLSAIGAAELFDVVVACGESDHVCALKPHPGGLIRAAEVLGISLDDCLVIGDRQDADGEGARRAGAAFMHVASLSCFGRPLLY
jgi:HAD superfamily hydrolase (TIGR01549 family)